MRLECNLESDSSYTSTSSTYNTDTEIIHVSDHQVVVINRTCFITYRDLVVHWTVQDRYLRLLEQRSRSIKSNDSFSKPVTSGEENFGFCYNQKKRKRKERYK